MGFYFNRIFKYVKASQRQFKRLCFVLFFKEKEKLTCKVQKDLFLCTNTVPVQ